MLAVANVIFVVLLSISESILLTLAVIAAILAVARVISVSRESNLVAIELEVDVIEPLIVVFKSELNFTASSCPNEPVDVAEPLILVAETFNNTAPSSLTVTSPPSAFNSISPATSKVKSPLDKSISVPSIVILSIVTPPSASTLLKVTDESVLTG